MKRMEEIFLRVSGVVLVAILLLGTIPKAEAAPMPTESSLTGATQEIQVKNIIVTEESEESIECKETVSVEPAYGQESTKSTAAREQLGPVGRALYDYLMPAFAEIAAGERTSVAFRLHADDLAAFGVGNRYAYVEGEENRIIRGFSEEMELDRVLGAVLHDCPYELYWFDKTAGVIHQFSLTTQEDGYGRVRIFQMIYQVSPNYRSETYPETLDENELDSSLYTVDTEKMAATAVYRERAEEIVAGGEGLSDYQRMQYYVNRICHMTDYDDELASSVDPVIYGDQFQLSNVFDDDPETRVVCEGYAKAFQWLCDLTEFNDPAVACYTVMGDMDGEAHMWNVVTMGNGESYLVDVTNSEAGTSGAGGKLFLVGAEGSAANGYRVRLSQTRSVTYQYRDQYVLSLWGNGEDSPIAISNRAYVPSEIFIYVPKIAYLGRPLLAGLPESGSDVLYSCDGGADRNDEYRWSSAWYADDDGVMGNEPIDAPIHAGSYWLKVRAEGSDVKEKAARVVVSPAELTVTGAVAEDKIYDGTDRVTVTGLVLLGVPENVEVTIAQAECVLPSDQAGAYDRAILQSLTLAGEDAQNYRVSTPYDVSISMRILPKPITPMVRLSGCEWEYCGEAILPELTVLDGETELSFEEYVLTAENNVNAGTATVTVSDREGGNYTLTAQSVTFTISKRTPNVGLPFTITAIEGQTLGEIELPAGFSWQASTDTKVGDAGYRQFLVTYVPEDTQNEHSVSDLPVTITVRALVTYADKVIGKMMNSGAIAAVYFGGFAVYGMVRGIVLGLKKRRF